MHEILINNFLGLWCHDNQTHHRPVPGMTMFELLIHYLNMFVFSDKSHTPSNWIAI